MLASPFMAFAILLAHTPALLEGLAFVPERVGSRRSVPVFEVEPLRELVADPLRRLFLADLLASYTHVASGAIWVKSRRGWRHRRFSELDPAQFAELILTVPPDQRLVLYRRLGDLSLFLSGVFPDHAEAHALAPIAVESPLLVAGPLAASEVVELRPEDDTDAVRTRETSFIVPSTTTGASDGASLRRSPARARACSSLGDVAVKTSATDACGGVGDQGARCRCACARTHPLARSRSWGTDYPRT